MSHFERARLINEAYADYYVRLHVTAEQVSRMDQVHDADLRLSVVAFVGAEPVGMALIGRRQARGWVHSVGTLPAWRRRGIARAMLAQIVAAALESRLERLSLEVFEQNVGAYRLYESFGFRPSRELLTWRRDAEADPLPIPSRRLISTHPGALYNDLAAWQDQPPCWQRETATLRKLGSALRGYRLPAANPEPPYREVSLSRRSGAPDPAACCLVSGSEQGVSIMSAGIRPTSNAIAEGLALLQALSALHLGQAMSILNVPADDRLCRVLAALRFTVTTRQFEMIAIPG